MTDTQSAAEIAAIQHLADNPLSAHDLAYLVGTLSAIESQLSDCRGITSAMQEAMSQTAKHTLAIVNPKNDPAYIQVANRRNYRASKDEPSDDDAALSCGPSF